MKLRPENKCKFCCKLFCCQECRIKHEVSVHFTLFCEVINCDLCNGEEKIVFRNGHTNDFIDHLFRFHLPLHCRNCSVVFQNKVDLTAVHTCVSSELIENEKIGSKMAFEGEGKIEPIIEEELEQEKVTENGKSYDASVVDNGSSTNNSETSNRTPPNTLVRQTSTPMTKMLHEIKRRSYDSMSASSIQMSSIENCSSENDISPPVPSATSNLNVFKQPSRRMPVGVTPYRQIMSKSIQRAFNSQGVSRVRYANITPPLDLRTSPVIRRTITMEGNRKQRSTGSRNDTDMMDLRTTPVIRRTRQIEAKNLATVINARPAGINGTLNESDTNGPSDQNMKNSAQEKSSLSRSKSSNTFFETCISFESSVTSSNQIAETPKSTGLSKRSSSFSNRQIMKMSEEHKEQWFTPSPENADNTPAGTTKQLFVESLKENEAKEEDSNLKTDKENPPKGILWSIFSSVLRFTSAGETSRGNLASNENNSLIKRCASFTGILPKKPLINAKNDENPYKRRRTTTISEVEHYTQRAGDDDGNDSGKKIQRINGRPPIDRMRQS